MEQSSLITGACHQVYRLWYCHAQVETVTPGVFRIHICFFFNYFHFLYYLLYISTKM